VVSRSLEHAEWNNTRVLKDNLMAEVQALKQRARQDCFVFGGAGIISSLRQLGVIDEYRVIVHPIVLGSGTPLFTDVQERLRLQPMRSQTFDSGVVALYYRPA